MLLMNLLFGCGMCAVVVADGSTLMIKELGRLNDKGIRSSETFLASLLVHRATT
jgi:hypothetical protein